MADAPHFFGRPWQAAFLYGHETLCVNKKRFLQRNVAQHNLSVLGQRSARITRNALATKDGSRDRRERTRMLRRSDGVMHGPDGEV
ncbi:MAG TPA: hypothetical protein VMI52_14335 [Acetobacteraceae bacterium]|nr:hypothetical protein [Acetobacteraceae bacterium]